MTLRTKKLTEAGAVQKVYKLSEVIIAHYVMEICLHMTLDTTTEIRYNDNLTVTRLSIKKSQLVPNYARILYLILYRNICFEYLLESPQYNLDIC